MTYYSNNDPGFMDKRKTSSPHGMHSGYYTGTGAMVGVEPSIAYPKEVTRSDFKGAPSYADPPKAVTYGSIIDDFADSTTAHGLPRFITGSTWYWKIFWFLAFGLATYVFFRQALDILSEYRSFPYNTKIDVVTSTIVDFPAVTVCNMNRMRRSQLVGTRFEGVVDIDGGFDDAESGYSFFFDFSSTFWNEWYSSGWAWGSSVGGSLGASSGGPSSFGSSSIGGGGGGRKKRSTPYNPYEVFGDFDEVPETTDEDGELINPKYRGLRKHLLVRNPRAGPYSSSSVGGGGPSSYGGGGPSSYGGGGPSSSYGGGGFGGSSSYGGGGFGSSSYAWGTSSCWNFGGGGGGGYSSWYGGGPGGGYYSSYYGGGVWSSYWDEWFDEWDSWGNDLWGSWTFEYDDYYNWDVAGESDWQGFYEQSKTDDFSDIIDIANPTRDELEELGHQPEDFILQCTFDKRGCNYTDFRMWQNKAYGNCFTFNHGQPEESSNISIVRSTSKSGSTYGLHMTLFIEQPEYVGIFSQETGVRVSIHDRAVWPFPEDQGITAPTGRATSIGIRQNSIERLSDPWGNCTKEGEDTEFVSPVYQYSTLACKKQCVQDAMWERCECVSDIVGDREKCSYLNSTQQRCRQLIESLNNDDKLDCFCPTICSEVNYLYSTSTSLWPSDRYDEHLYTRVADKNDKAAHILQNVDLTRKNLARVRIYFEELNFQSIVQNPVYTFTSFLSSVGGLLGLYIGFSVITLAELILLVLTLIKHTFFGACCKTKVQPVVT